MDEGVDAAAQVCVAREDIWISPLGLEMASELKWYAWVCSFPELSAVRMSILTQSACSIFGNFSFPVEHAHRQDSRKGLHNFIVLHAEIGATVC